MQQNEDIPDEIVSEPEPASLKQLVEEDAKKYHSEEEVKELFNKLKENVESFKYSDKLKTFYGIDHEFIFVREQPANAEVIGSWLQRSGSAYFAEPTYKKTERNQDPFLMYGLSRVARELFPEELSGFRITARLPYESIALIAKAHAHFPNLLWSKCTVILLVSKTDLRIFYYYANYVEKSWGIREIGNDVVWKTRAYPLGNHSEIIDSIIAIQEGFVDWILNQLEERFSIIKA